MVMGFKPRLELLEAREVPAVNWTWTPQNLSTNGAFRKLPDDGSARHVKVTLLRNSALVLCLPSCFRSSSIASTGFMSARMRCMM